MTDNGIIDSTAVVVTRPAINEVIVVEQLPVIREQLQLMSKDINSDVEYALSLEVNDDTVKAIKQVRARLNKDSGELEKKRIEAKNKIMEPYNQFEAIYKECISSVYSNADSTLKRRIDSVENALKDKKWQEVKTYFDEYCLSKEIKFVTFEQANINVTLTASLKSLKTQAKAFVDKVAEDVVFISDDPNAAEILVEYCKSLNCVQAMQMVAQRHKAVEVEQQRIKQAQEAAEAKANSAKRVEQVIQEVAPPIAKPLVAPTIEEKLCVARFEVCATKPQLRELASIMKEKGITFKSI